MLEILLVTAIVLATAGLLGWRWYRVLSGRGDCCGCTRSCSGNQVEPGLPARSRSRKGDTARS